MIYNNSFLSSAELSKLGLKRYGENVLISKYVQFYSPSTIELGNNVRIDDYCILSGSITLGSNIHIAAYCALYGSKGIVMENNTGLSPRVTIFSAMDDFSGDYLIGPVHNDKETKVTGGCVFLEEFSQIGAGCIVFPNLKISKGSVVGAMSLVNKSLDEWSIYAGIPIKKLKERNKGLLKF